jgi:hypothetical protein
VNDTVNRRNDIVHRAAHVRTHSLSSLLT